MNDNVNKIIDFSKTTSVENIFNKFYNFLSDKWKIIELDLFLVNDNQISRLNDISASVGLEDIYNELEERGLLEFASNTNEIKIIPNIDVATEQIKSIIIIPIFLFNKLTAYFIANSSLNQNEINISDTNIVHLVAEHSFSLINIYKTDIDKNVESKKYNLLKQQIVSASNQISLSELLIALNDSFEIPQKIIKTNLELIQKGIGDSKRRMDIIEEQLNSILLGQTKIQKLSADIKNIPASYNINDIIEQVGSIVSPILNRFGVSLSINLNDNAKININCFNVQIIFAIYTFVLKSVSTMQDGGIINIGLFKNDNKTISIIISDDGQGLEKDVIEGNIIADIELSPQKMRLHFLYTLAQNIIISHNGKLSVYSENGKGTTYKIILPV